MWFAYYDGDYLLEHLLEISYLHLHVIRSTYLYVYSSDTLIYLDLKFYLNACQFFFLSRALYFFLQATKIFLKITQT